MSMISSTNTIVSASDKLETESVKSASTNHEDNDDIESIKSEIEPSTSSYSGGDKSNRGDMTESAIETFHRELENSFAPDVQGGMTGASTSNGGGGGGSGSFNGSAGTSRKSASLNRIYQSLGNSNTSISSKASPSNSAKSNSAPSRVRYSILTCFLVRIHCSCTAWIIFIYKNQFLYNFTVL